MKRVIYNELRHKDHTATLYKNNPIKYENEANRYMIHKLLDEELMTSISCNT